MNVVPFIVEVNRQSPCVIVILEALPAIIGWDVVCCWEFKTVLRNAPKPTMRINTMTMMAETPRETAPFAFAKVGTCESVVRVLFEITQQWVCSDDQNTWKIAYYQIALCSTFSYRSEKQGLSFPSGKKGLPYRLIPIIVIFVLLGAYLGITWNYGTGSLLANTQHSSCSASFGYDSYHRQTLAISPVSN